MKRALSYLIAPLVCLAVWWRVPFLFFRDDDFSWLTLHSLPLREALFSPFAQGTVRVFSERLYFIALYDLFGLAAWPFRAAALGGWFVALMLTQWIGEQLTGSRAAGVLGAILWTVSVTLATPLGWASAFNQVFIAAIILGAFAAHIQRRYKLEAALYLIGFGVLEIIVMYPLVVLLYECTRSTQSRDRKRADLFRPLWMLFPAALFTALHLFVIPKTDAEVYRRIIDSRLPATLWQYIQWTVGPSQMEVRNAARVEQGLLATWIIAAALAVFALTRLARRDLRALLFLGWFVLWLAPVLPLPNHISDYYLTVPGIGLAWLAGWALVSAWRSGWLFRIPATAFALVYLAGSAAEVDAVTKWFFELTAKNRVLVRGLEATAAKYPSQPILLTRVDPEVFLHAVAGGADRTLGIKQIWLAPDQDEVLDSGRLPDLQRFRAPSNLPLLRVLDLEGPIARDITPRYTAARNWGLSSLSPPK